MKVYLGELKLTELYKMENEELIDTLIELKYRNGYLSDLLISSILLKYEKLSNRIVDFIFSSLNDYNKLWDEILLFTVKQGLYDGKYLAIVQKHSKTLPWFLAEDN